MSMQIAHFSRAAAKAVLSLAAVGLAGQPVVSAELDKRIFLVETAAGSGSAFVIGPATDGRCVLVTSWHVIEDNAPQEPLVIKKPDGAQFQVSRSAFKADPVLDLAFMPASNCNNSIKLALLRANAITVSTRVFIKGYPISMEGQSQGPVRPSTAAGRVTLYSDITGYDLSYDAPTRPGYSGGPVLSENSSVLLGVHGMTDTVQDSQDYELREALRVGGRGVSAPLLYRFLRSHGYTMPRSQPAACLVGVC